MSSTLVERPTQRASTVAAPEEAATSSGRSAAAASQPSGWTSFLSTEFRLFGASASTALRRPHQVIEEEEQDSLISSESSAGKEADLSQSVDNSSNHYASADEQNKSSNNTSLLFEIIPDPPSRPRHPTAVSVENEEGNERMAQLQQEVENLRDALAQLRTEQERTVHSLQLKESKLKPFNGTSDTETWIQFVKRFDTHATSLSWSPERKLKVLGAYLDDGPADIFSSLTPTQLNSYDTAIAAMTEQLLPQYVIERFEGKLFARKQRATEPVIPFSLEIKNLGDVAYAKENPEKREMKTKNAFARNLISASARGLAFSILSAKPDTTYSNLVAQLAAFCENNTNDLPTAITATIETAMKSTLNDLNTEIAHLRKKGIEKQQSDNNSNNNNRNNSNNTNRNNGNWNNNRSNGNWNNNRYNNQNNWNNNGRNNRNWNSNRNNNGWNNNRNNGNWNNNRNNNTRNNWQNRNNNNWRNNSNNNNWQNRSNYNNWQNRGNAPAITAPQLVYVTPPPQPNDIHQQQQQYMVTQPYVTFPNEQKQYSNKQFYNSNANNARVSAINSQSQQNADHDSESEMTVDEMLSRLSFNGNKSNQVSMVRTINTINKTPKIVSGRDETSPALLSTSINECIQAMDEWRQAYQNLKEKWEKINEPILPTPFYKVALRRDLINKFKSKNKPLQRAEKYYRRNFKNRIKRFIQKSKTFQVPNRYQYHSNPTQSDTILSTKSASLNDDNETDIDKYESLRHIDYKPSNDESGNNGKICMITTETATQQTDNAPPPKPIRQSVTEVTNEDMPLSPLLRDNINQHEIFTTAPEPIVSFDQTPPQIFEVERSQPNPSRFNRQRARTYINLRKGFGCYTITIFSLLFWFIIISWLIKSATAQITISFPYHNLTNISKSSDIEVIAINYIQLIDTFISFGMIITTIATVLSIAHILYKQLLERQLNYIFCVKTVALVLFFLLSWYTKPIKSQTSDTPFYHCGSTHGGILVAIPEIENCDSPSPDQIISLQANVFVPKTTPFVTNAIHCSHSIRIICTKSFLSLWPTMIRDDIATLQMTKSECEEAWQFLKVNNTQLYQINENYYTSNISEQYDYPSFGTKCIQIHRWSILIGKIMTSDGNLILSSIADVTNCTFAQQSCADHSGGYVLWNSTIPQDFCQYHSIGTHNITASKGLIMIPRLQIALRFESTFLPKDAKCIPPVSYTLSGNVVISMDAKNDLRFWIVQTHRTTTTKWPKIIDESIPILEHSQQQLIQENVNQKLRFLEEWTKQQVLNNFNYLFESYCQLRNTDIRTMHSFISIDPSIAIRFISQRPDLTAIAVGDGIFRINLCKQIFIQSFNTDHAIGTKCYQHVPVTSTNNLQFFWIKGTRELVLQSPEIKCDHRPPPPIFYIGGIYSGQHGPVAVQRIHHQGNHTAHFNSINFDAPSIYSTNRPGEYTFLPFLTDLNHRLSIAESNHMLTKKYLQSLSGDPSLVAEVLDAQATIIGKFGQNMENVFETAETKIENIAKAVGSGFIHIILPYLLLLTALILALVIAYFCIRTTIDRRSFNRIKQLKKSFRQFQRENTRTKQPDANVNQPTDIADSVQYSEIANPQLPSIIISQHDDNIANSTYEDIPESTPINEPSTSTSQITTPLNQHPIRRLPSLAYVVPFLLAIATRANDAKIAVIHHIDTNQPSSLPLLLARVDHLAQMCLIDSGSTVSLMNRSEWNYYSKKKKLKLLPLTITKCDSVGNHPIKLIGEYPFTVRIGSAKIEVLFRIIESDILSTNCLLGYDSLISFGTYYGLVIFDFKNNTIAFGPNVKKLLSKQQTDSMTAHISISADDLVYDVRTTEDIILPPYSDNVIPGIIDSSIPLNWTLMIDHPDKNHRTFSRNQRIQIGRSLTHIDKDGHVNVCMINPTCDTIKLYRHQRIATASLINDTPQAEVSAIITDKETDVELDECAVYPEPGDLPPPDFSNIEFKDTNIDENQKQQFRAMLQKHAAVFQPIIGRFTGTTTHVIELIPGSPIIRSRPYKIAYNLEIEVLTQIRDLLAAGIIEPSTSQYSSPIVMVKKGKTGNWRFCLDYRRLNAISKVASFRLPRINELFASMANSVYFSRLDLRKAYYQIKMDDDSADYTSFITAAGLFRFRYMPFGLAGAPSTFQSAMEEVTMSIGNRALCYLDDLMICSTSFMEHLADMDAILTRLGQFGLTASLEKSAFASLKMKYLGHIVSEAGVQLDPETISAIRQLPIPTSKKLCQSIIGAASWIRRYVKSFATLIHPLIQLTKIKNEKKFCWTPEAHRAWNNLKIALTTTPVLAFPRLSTPYLIITDASKIGYGSTLLQVQKDNTYRIINFASRVTTPAEQNYSATESELNCILYSLNHNREYVMNTSVVCLTDHRPLVLLSKKQDMVGGRITRILINLTPFNYEIKYFAGRENLLSDFLSRHPILTVTDDETMTTVHNISTLPPICPELNLDNIRKQQQNDTEISYVIDYLKNNILPLTPREANRTKRLAAGKEIVDEVLMTTERSLRGRTVGHLIIVPNSMIMLILNQFHSQKHQGAARLQQDISIRFHWPTIQKDCQSFTKNCKTCQLTKPASGHLSHHVQLRPFNPPIRIFQRLHIDTIFMPTTITSNRYILIIVEALTRWTIAIPLPDSKSTTLIKAIINNVFYVFGQPEEIVNDSGSVFTSQQFVDFCERFSIRQQTSIASRHNTNGLAERKIYQLCEILKLHALRDGSTWDEQVPYAVFLLNNTYSSSINNTPHFCLMGYDTIFSYESIMNYPIKRYADTLDYVDEMANTVQTTRQLAIAQLQLQRPRLAADYNQRFSAKPHTFKKNDLVLMQSSEKPPKGVCARFHDRYFGPARIVSIDDNGIVLLEFASNAPRQFVRTNIDYCKVFHDDNVIVSHPPSSEQETIENNDISTPDEKMDKNSDSVSNYTANVDWNGLKENSRNNENHMSSTTNADDEAQRRHLLSQSLNDIDNTQSKHTVHQSSDGQSSSSVRILRRSERIQKQRCDEQAAVHHITATLQRKHQHNSNNIHARMAPRCRTQTATVRGRMSDGNESFSTRWTTTLGHHNTSRQQQNENNNIASAPYKKNNNITVAQIGNGMNKSNDRLVASSLWLTLNRPSSSDFSSVELIHELFSVKMATPNWEGIFRAVLSNASPPPTTVFHYRAPSPGENNRLSRLIRRAIDAIAVATASLNDASQIAAASPTIHQQPTPNVTIHRSTERPDRKRQMPAAVKRQRKKNAVAADKSKTSKNLTGWKAKHANDAKKAAIEIEAARLGQLAAKEAETALLAEFATTSAFCNTLHWPTNDGIDEPSTSAKRQRKSTQPHHHQP